MSSSVFDRRRSGSEVWLAKWLWLLLALPALYLVSRYHFLLFHTLAELFGVVVAYSVFVLAWNSRRHLDNNYLLFLGLAFPFIGILHLVHTLAYKNMGVISGDDPYIATQVWISARFALAAVFLIAPAFLNRRLNTKIVLAGWGAVTAFLLLALFVWDLFPAMFVEGRGLTPFKKTSEYVICAMFLASLYPLYRSRSYFAPSVYRMLVGAVLLAFVAELPFTLYSNVFDSFNASGHLLSIVSFYFVYLALVVTGLRQPQQVLFRNLKQREEALAESEARLKLALDAGRMGTFDWAMDENRVEWSEGHYRLLGYRPGELEPSIDAFETRLHPDDRERHQSILQQAIENRAEYVGDFRVVWPDRSVHWLEGRGQFVHDPDDRPVRMYGVLTDITLRKELEEERQNLLEAERAARTEAERLNRMKDEFLATVSHELRSPLTAIVGWSKLLSNERVEVRKASRIIGRSAASLSRIVEDLLDMSRIISGKIRLIREPVNLVEVVANAIEGAQFSAESRSIHVDVSYDPDLQELDCDPGRVQQIVWNLLTNAIKFTPEGGRVVVAVGQSHTYVTIKVQDTGKGIAPEFLPHIFERFRQEDGSIARRHGGLGLGLSIVKNMVELHGGAIEAHSPGEGKGATFIVTLPRAGVVDERTLLPASRPSDGVETIAVDERTLDGIRILCVDDDSHNREILGRSLTDAGATVRTAACPDEAFSLLENFRPDVLLSDVGMPGEDGYTFIRRLRACGDWRADLTCIAVTALSRPEDRERALQVGFNEHIGKPFEPAALCQAVARLVGGRTSEASTEMPAAGGVESNGRPHVLLTEDDDCIAQMFKTILEVEGYRVSVADSTARACTICADDPVDMVISDLVLKDGMGWDLLAKMQTRDRVPAILMSGYSEPEYIDRSKAAGFAEYLTKPVDADDLVDAVKRAMSRAKA